MVLADRSDFEPEPGASRPGKPAARYRATRTLLALAVAVMGTIDLASALLSHPSDRLRALLRLVPTEVLDTSRTFTLLAGALLLVTAWGLRRGKRRAFIGALLLCAISVPFNLLKAIDFEEATVAAALMFFLGISGDAFRVKSREISLSALSSRATWAFAGLLVYAVVGSWLLKVVFGYQPSLSRAFADAAYNLFGIGHPVAALPAHLPPSERRIIEWYLHSLPVLSLTFVLGFAVTALSPATHRRRRRADAELASGLLRDFGASSVSAFALAEDSDYYFSPNRRAVIAYRFVSDTLLAIGDPIGPAEEMFPLLRGFEMFCRERDWQFAFFQTRPELLPLYRELGWRALHIGEDPVLWTERFTLEGPAVADARRAIRKAESAGLEVCHFDPRIDPFDLARDGPALLPALQSISNEWLHAHPGGEKGFCMGRFTPERLAESWLAVARNGRDGRVEGFVTWVPIWARHGWALDLMRRRSDAAVGAMELLVARSVEAARRRGDAMLSLSLSALAQVDGAGNTPDPVAALSTESRRAREFLMEHLARFYDFKGLFRWKKKFAPTFEDRFLVYSGAMALPQVTLALVRAQSPGGLLSYARGAESGRPHEDRDRAPVALSG
jgi:phosphatidylglycerol lysyltransferase